MIIFGGGRLNGKTSKLIRISDITRAPILCSSVQKKRAIMELAQRLRADIPKPVTLEEIRFLPDCEVLVDDVEAVLSKILKRRIAMMTTSAVMFDLTGGTSHGKDG